MNRVGRGVWIALTGALVVFSTAALASFAPAKPQAQNFPSTLDFGKADFDSRPGRIIVYGDVESANSKCLANRAVKLKFSDDGGESYKFQDTSSTSTNGDWVGDGPAAATTVKVILAKSKFGSRKHPKSCGADTLLLD